MKVKLKSLDKKVLTRGDLVAKIAEKTGYSRPVCRLMFDQGLAAILTAMGKGQVVLLNDFGKFEVILHKNKKQWSFQLNKMVDQRPLLVMKFRPSEFVKQVLARSQQQ